MSLQTWCAEFYPVDAKDATGTALEAAEHSLRKWRGMRADALNRHNVDHGSFCLNCGAESLDIDGSTCSLCVFDGKHRDTCDDCPLFHLRGERCGYNGVDPSPYYAYVNDEDPEPMIAWLEKTVEHLKAGVKA